MALVVNGVTIPTNGDFIVVNGVKVDKVVCNGVEVWKKITDVPMGSASDPLWSENVHHWGYDDKTYDEYIGKYTFNTTGYQYITIYVTQNNSLTVTSHWSPILKIGGGSWVKVQNGVKYALNGATSATMGYWYYDDEDGTKWEGYNADFKGWAVLS